MKYTTLSLAAALSFTPLSSNAIVNVENMRVGPDQPGLSGNIDGRISGQRGNTDKNEYGVNGRVQYVQGNKKDFVVVSYDYGEANNIENTNKSFVHGRHVERMQPKLAWEAFTQAEKNRFARLTFRGLIGGGLRFTVAEEVDRIGLYVGAGAFFSRETLEARTGLTDHGSSNFSRANFYVSYKHKLNSQVSIISTTYYQPRLGDARDMRALEQAALAVKMSERLSLKVAIDISHDSRPPQAVDKTDTSFSTGISYQF